MARDPEREFFRGVRNDLWRDITEDGADEIRRVEDERFLQYVSEAIRMYVMPVINIPDTYTVEQIRLINGVLDDAGMPRYRAQVQRIMQDGGLDPDLLVHLSPQEAKMFILGFVVRGWDGRKRERVGYDNPTGGYALSADSIADTTRFDRLRRRKDGPGEGGSEGKVGEGTAGHHEGGGEVPDDGAYRGGVSFFVD